MTTENLNKIEHQMQGEILIAEVRAFLALLMITPMSLKETSEMIMKIEKWEASK